jgi:hypothetical protein
MWVYGCNYFVLRWESCEGRADEWKVGKSESDVVGELRRERLQVGSVLMDMIKDLESTQRQ